MLAQTIIAQNEHRLLQEMNQVQAELQFIGVQCDQGFDEVSDIGDMANHMVELCTDLAVRDLYQQKSRQIEQAWARFRNGQYGICESCGAQIDPDRLNIMPHATTCVSCQRQKESAK